MESQKQLDMTVSTTLGRGDRRLGTCSPSRNTPWAQDSGHKLHHLNMCQCPATKLFSCWGQSCRIKQYIMTRYKWGKNNLFPLFLRKRKIKPIIFNPRQLTNLKFSPIGKKITAWLGFISFSFFSPHLFILHLLTQNPKSEKIYIFSQKYVSYILLTYSKGKAPGIHHTSIKPLSNT